VSTVQNYSNMAAISDVQMIILH